ncbi:MAG: hypothetical protein MI864_02810 [Pseudomonadales bacterium]|nr:hypothetical protein [Pseudomonadales bacterium]
MSGNNSGSTLADNFNESAQNGASTQQDTSNQRNSSLQAETTEQTVSESFEVLTESSSDAEVPTITNQVNPESVPQPGKLIHLSEHEGAERLARDINAKIDDLESQLGGIGDLFAKSQEALTRSLDELQSRSFNTAAEIERVANRLELSSSQQLELTKALDQRFNDSFREFAAQMVKASEAIQEQHSRLNSLDSSHQQLSEMHEELEAVAGQRDQAFQSFAKQTGEQLSLNKAQLANMSALHSEHQDALKVLTQDHTSLEDVTQGLREKLQLLETGVAETKVVTNKRIGWLVGSVAALALLTAASTTYFQFYPTTVPEEVQGQISALSTDSEQQLGLINALDSGLTLVQDKFAELEASLFSQQQQSSEIQTEVTNNAQSIASLSAMDAEMLASVEKLQTTLAAVNSDIDNLKFRIEGPSNQGAGLTEPTLPLNGHDWLFAQNPEHYSIQLVGVYQKQHLVSYINRNSHVLSDQPIAFNEGKLGLRSWYNLFYGHYATREQAEAALETLPLRLQTNSPYIRSFESIQRKTVQ